MGIYSNTKCGNCGISISGGYERNGTVENFSRLGPEYIRCFNCGKINKTGLAPWKKLYFLEKVWILLWLLITFFLYGFLGGMIGGGILAEVFDIYDDNFSLYFSFTLTLILSFFGYRGFIHNYIQ